MPLWHITSPIFGHPHHPYDEAKHHESLATAKKVMAILNNHLKGKTFLVGSRVSIADIALASSFVWPYKAIFEEKERKHFGNISAWYENIASKKAFQEAFGPLRLCKKQFPIPKVAHEEHKQAAQKGGKKE